MGFYRGPNIVTDGLVYAIDAGSERSYPGSGTVATDLVGSNTGTLTNGVGFSTSNGGYWEFDGIDDLISITMIPLNDFTITQFVNMDDAHNQMPIGGGLYTNGSDYLGYTWFFKGENQVRIKVDGEVGPNFGVNTSLWAAKWISYTATRSGGTYKLYINGELLDTQTSSTNQYSVRTIGWGYSNSYAMQGDLGNTLIYNAALNDAQVKQNFNARKSRYGL